MAFTEDTANDVLNHVFRNEKYTSPETVYVGLFKGDDEVDGDGYERKEISFGSPDNGRIKNDEEIKFDIAEEDWGEITEAGVFDSDSGGNRLDKAEIENAREVRKNDQFTIPEGDYTIEVK